MLMRVANAVVAFRSRRFC